MIKKYLPLTALLLGLAVFPVAHADTLVRDAAIGATLGAVIGSTVDSHDGAVVGGLLGAVIGASLSESDEASHEYRPMQTYYVPTHREVREPPGEIHRVAYMADPRENRYPAARDNYRDAGRHERRD